MQESILLDLVLANFCLKLDKAIYMTKWMTDNKLKLNNDKTELLILHTHHRLSPSLDSVYADTELIKASESVKNIGVWFDKTLLMKKHVNSVCKTAFYQLRHLATMRRFLSYQHFEILIRAFVTSRLDYRNSLLSGLPQNLLQKTSICTERCCPFTIIHSED